MTDILETENTTRKSCRSNKCPHRRLRKDSLQKHIKHIDQRNALTDKTKKKAVSSTDSSLSINNINEWYKIMDNKTRQYFGIPELEESSAIKKE